jgi:GNAT superfamily N-acetyltransferase
MPNGDGTEGKSLRLVLRPAGVDAWSEIRSLHAASFKAMAGPLLETAHVAAFIERVYSPDYTDSLVMQDLQTAWHDRQLVGTAGWVPADDAGTSARITAVYVAPLFTRLGVGRQLVTAAEARARAAGFHAYAARVFPQALGFFEALGYVRSSQGAIAIGTENGIPVTFMRKAGPDADEVRDRRAGREQPSEDTAAAPAFTDRGR